MYVLAVYLYLRAGELRALEWSDIDMERGIVLVHQAEDDEGAVATTKGKRSRPFVIELVLLPLLRAMHEKAGGRRARGPVHAGGEAPRAHAATRPRNRGRGASRSVRERRHAQAAPVPRPPRDRDHLDGHPGRRPAEDQAARRARLVLHEKRPCLRS